jgi:hypothetical protein
MRIKITENLSIPIIWVGMAYVPTTAFVIGVALWVYTVDLRLARIESKLGIEPLPARAGLILKTADAKEK